MEYDNDRLIKPINKAEIFCWVILCILYPLVNSVSVFSADIAGSAASFIWGTVLVLLCNLLLMPAYFFYARVVVPNFLFKYRPLLFAIISTGIFLFVHLFLFVLHAIIKDFNLSPLVQRYFSYSTITFIRESVWIFIYMSLATMTAYIKKTRDEKDMISGLEKDNNFLRLRYLRAQLNPHFLFNTLNSIYSLTLNKSEQAPEMVIKLSDLMRYMVYECNEEKVPLEKEIAFIRNYIDIENTRHNADIRFSVEGDTAGVMIEPFLFIAFIENGFKHALESAHASPFVYINIKIEKNEIILNVINNTNVSLELQAKRLNGTGIKNSKSLLELLYPHSYVLNIIQTEKDRERNSKLRIKNARERLETLYPDSHTLDVILSNNAFTISLVIKSALF